MIEVQDWTLEDIAPGAAVRFEKLVTERDIDTFALVSGDHNPLHTDPDYAGRAGYRDRVVHGAYLVALVSRLVGMGLPGRRSLLLGLRLDFAAACFPGDRLDVRGEVQHLSVGERVVVLKITVHSGGELRARGQAHVRVLE